MTLIPDDVRKFEGPILEVASYIYNNPELGGDEHKAVSKIASVLKRYGLTMKMPLLGMETAFSATFGSGTHVMVMAEYDALPSGHACGHNLIAAWAVGVTLALHADRDFKGKLTLVGTPAEEGYGPYPSSKVIIGPEMKRRGVKAVFAVHPRNEWLIGGRRHGLSRAKFVFTGKEAHSSMHPDLARNALDAAVTFYLSLKMLRSLVKRSEDVTISAVITDGGKMPNVIPGKSEVIVDVRCNGADYITKMNSLVEKRAKSAAALSNCSVKVERTNPTMLPSKRYQALDSLLYKSTKKYGIQVEDPEKTWARDPMASTDYGNVSQIIPSTHLTMNIAPQGIFPHMLEFEKHANPARAKNALMLSIAITCDAIKNYVNGNNL